MQRFIWDAKGKMQFSGFQSIRDKSPEVKEGDVLHVILTSFIKK